MKLTQEQMSLIEEADSIVVIVKGVPQLFVSEKKTTFKKPTISEIATYCQERQNGVDPVAFYDFYEAKNWMIGKNKMKNWEAAVRNWERNNPVRNNQPNYQSSSFDVKSIGRRH